MEMAKLKNQGVAQAFIKLWGEEPQDVQIAEVVASPFGPDSERLIDQTRNIAISANGAYYTPIEQLESERSQRQIEAFGETLRFSSDIALSDDSAESDHPIDADDPFN